MKYTKRFALRVDEETKEKVRKKAKEQGVKPSDYARLILEKSLSKEHRFNEKQKDVVGKLFKTLSVYFLSQENRVFIKELAKLVHKREFETFEDIITSFRQAGIKTYEAHKAIFKSKLN